MTIASTLKAWVRALSPSRAPPRSAAEVLAERIRPLWVRQWVESAHCLSPDGGVNLPPDKMHLLHALHELTSAAAAYRETPDQGTCRTLLEAYLAVREDPAMAHRSATFDRDKGGWQYVETNLDTELGSAQAVRDALTTLKGPQSPTGRRDPFSRNPSAT